MIIWKKSELRKTSQITIHFSSFCTLCIDGVRWLLQWLLLMMASGWALITHKTTCWYCEFNLIILISIIIGLEILRMIYKRNEYLIFNWAKLRSFESEKNLLSFIYWQFSKMISNILRFFIWNAIFNGVSPFAFGALGSLTFDAKNLKISTQLHLTA